jgi:hypothetical protein
MATFVVVHGAGHGGWCYRKVEGLLRAKGHNSGRPHVGLAQRRRSNQACAPPPRGRRPSWTDHGGSAVTLATAGICRSGATPVVLNSVFGARIRCVPYRHLWDAVAGRVKARLGTGNGREHRPMCARCAFHEVRGCTRERTAYRNRVAVAATTSVWFVELHTVRYGLAVNSSVIIAAR